MKKNNYDSEPIPFDILNTNKLNLISVNVEKSP